METSNWRVRLLADVAPGSCVLDNDSDGGFIALSLAPEGDSVGLTRFAGEGAGRLSQFAKGMRHWVVELGDVELDLDHGNLAGLVSVGRAEGLKLLRRGLLVLLGDHPRILVRNNSGEPSAASLRDGSLVPLTDPNAMICPVGRWRLVRRVGNEIREVHSFTPPDACA